MALGLSVVNAAAAAKLSVRKWHAVEAGSTNHTELTLRAVASSLGEDPRHLLFLAGYSSEPEVVLEPDRLFRLERQVAELLAEIRSLRLPPGTPPAESPGT